MIPNVSVGPSQLGDSPHIDRGYRLRIFDEPRASVRRGVVRAAGAPSGRTGRRSGVVTALIKNAPEIIARRPFIEVHVVVAIGIGFFAEDNCAARVRDGLFLDAVSIIQAQRVFVMPNTLEIIRSEER